MKMTTVVWVNDFVHLSENFSERGNFFPPHILFVYICCLILEIKV